MPVDKAPAGRLNSSGPLPTNDTAGSTEIEKPTAYADTSDTKAPTPEVPSAIAMPTTSATMPNEHMPTAIAPTDTTPIATKPTAMLPIAMKPRAGRRKLMSSNFILMSSEPISMCQCVDVSISINQ